MFTLKCRLTSGSNYLSCNFYTWEIISRLYPRHLRSCYQVVDQDGKLLASNMFAVVTASLLPFLTLDQQCWPHPCSPPPAHNKQGFSLCSGKMKVYNESSIFFSFSWLIYTLMFLFPFLVLIPALTWTWLEYSSASCSELEFFCPPYYCPFPM